MIKSNTDNLKIFLCPACIVDHDVRTTGYGYENKWGTEPEDILDMNIPVRLCDEHRSSDLIRTTNLAGKILKLAREQRAQ